MNLMYESCNKINRCGIFNIQTQIFSKYILLCFMKAHYYFEFNNNNISSGVAIGSQNQISPMVPLEKHWQLHFACNY